MVNMLTRLLARAPFLGRNAKRVIYSSTTPGAQLSNISTSMQKNESNIVSECVLNDSE